MSLRLLHPLVIFSAVWFLAGLSASANSGFGTPASFVIEDEPNDLIIDVFYVVYRPSSFPNALFLVEFRRADYGEWKRSIGKTSFASSESGIKTLTVTWTTGPLKGEIAVLEIPTSTSVRWKDGKSGKKIAFERPPFGQQFDVKTAKLPWEISSRLPAMRTTSLHHAILDLEKLR